MTLKEFSDEFDVLANSFSSGGSVEFDEYEKSVFLTKAQEQVIKGLYSGKLGLDSFEKTEELRRSLNNLVKTNTFDKVTSEDTVTSDSYVFNLPDDLLYITYESVNIQDKKAGCMSGNVAEVVPVTQDDLHKTYQNPFRGPSINRVLRLDKGLNQDNKQQVEIVSKYNIGSYKIRYVSKPAPIILVQLEGDLEIDGESQPSECILDDSVHRTILELAVQFALQSRALKS